MHDQQHPDQIAAVQSPPRLHLPMLDGIRGLAAIYVAMYHALGYTGYLDSLQTQSPSVFARLLAEIISYGFYAVPIFIVVSGFSLMLPLVQRDTEHIPGGIGAFISRRAWRILPSYYVALLLSLLLIAFIPVLQSPSHTAWDNKIPLSFEAILAHVLLLHNLHPEWLFKISGPLWSIVIEWQIYFLFPLLLLPILRRSNMLVMVLSALLIGLLPHYLLPEAYSIDYSHPWFLGLFALGAAGAAIAVSERPSYRAIRERVPWRWLSPLLILAFLAGLILARHWLRWNPHIAETLIGLVVAVVLIQYTTDSRHQRQSWPQRFLESRPLLLLGAFSYSIYLVHDPVLALINFFTLNMPMPIDLRLLMMTGLAVPFAVFVSYGFYVLVERRFIRLRQQSTTASKLAQASTTA